VREFRNILSLIIGISLISSAILAQNGREVDVKGMSAKKLKLYGKNADRLGDVYSAVDFLEPYCKLRPGDLETNYRLAELYFASRDYTKAEKLFAKLYKNDPDAYPQALYYEALSMKYQGKYAEAKEIFTKFQRRLKSTKNPPTTAGALKEEIASCDEAADIVAKPLKVAISHLGSSVNGPHEELSPLLLDDGELLYSSLKLDSTYYFMRDDTTAIPVRQFYTARKSGEDWTGGQLFSSQINIPGVETGNGALSRDGKRFYFTRSKGRTPYGRMRSEIWVAKKVGQSWGEPEKLNALVNDPNYTSTQPAIGYTSKSELEVVYFVSDRTGGKGGLDIWYTIYDPRKKEYSQPRNAGSKINTSGDEMTPYYDMVTRQLYFSSTGHNGIGGFDVFRAMGELRKWFPSENVGYPINSSYDDLYFTIDKGREDGFLVSNRPSPNSFRNPSCCDDIYQYRWTDFIRVAVTGTVYPVEAAKLGKNLDQAQLMAMKNTIKPLEKGIISLYMVDKKTKERLFIARDSIKNDGNYKFDVIPDRDYKLEMEGFQYFNEQVNISTDGVNFTYTIEMPPIYVNVLSDKPIVLKNVYYELDKSDLTTEAKKAIDSTLYELMQKATDIVVEVSAHTDSIGNAEYNKKLSQERAENVVKYLVSKGVNKKRLIAKGYGAEKPVAPNKKPDGSDNPEGREKNRRSEFRVIGTLSSQTEDVDIEETQ
jgi:Outer membrane protein and related peptidoglycan-associated (lipo)proteins